MLGSVADAEDVVQEALLRLARVEGALDALAESLSQAFLVVLELGETAAA